ncbi:MAG: glutathione peroxidase [Rubricella sp.]
MPIKPSIPSLAVAFAACAGPAWADAYSHTLPSLDGGVLDLEDRRGNVTLVVNTASLCGFTGQYDALQALHEAYMERGFAVIGVPSDDFGGQELESDAEVAEFCEVNFAITFPMSTIQRVRGPNAHPLFDWIAEESIPPRWNFFKYLVDRDGEIVAVWPSQEDPMGQRIRRAVEGALITPSG